MLPRGYEAVIFDEAHGLEDAATEFFGTTVSSHRFEELARDAQGGAAAGGRAVGGARAGGQGGADAEALRPRRRGRWG